MATDIFDRSVSDHVVFDRIVDVDRTITLARQAADEAEKRGQSDKAAKLRAKADYLEEILNNTQDPDYSDEEESIPPEQSNAGEGDSGAGEGEEESEEEKDEGEGSGSDDEEKQPEDIDNLDQSNDIYAAGTNQHQGGGPSGDSQGGGRGGFGNNKPKNQGNGQSKGKGQNKELDPFRVSSNRQQGNQKQPTKEEILDAIIKKLSGLSGEAKKGADKALQDYFNNVSGGGTL